MTEPMSCQRLDAFRQMWMVGTDGPPDGLDIVDLRDVSDLLNPGSDD